MTILYHVSPNNFDQFSINHSGQNFGNEASLSGNIFLTPNFNEAAHWAVDIAFSKGGNSSNFRKLLEKSEKDPDNGPKVFSPHEMYKYLFLYKVEANRNDLKRWEKRNWWNKEILVPPEDLDKLKIVGKKRYESWDLIKRHRDPIFREENDVQRIEDLFGKDSDEYRKKIEKARIKEEKKMSDDEFRKIIHKKRREEKRKKYLEKLKSIQTNVEKPEKWIKPVNIYFWRAEKDIGEMVNYKDDIVLVKSVDRENKRVLLEGEYGEFSVSIDNFLAHRS